MRSAQVQVAQLANFCDVGSCDSEFNSDDLRSKGWVNTAVVPILLDLGAFDTEQDEATCARLRRRNESGGSNWLFVGALSPHKAQHLLVAAFASYRRDIDPSATLSLVGRPVVGSYADALGKYISELGLADCVEIAGGVTHRQLVSYYHSADVLVSASQHEGFCVPLLEAMYHGLPVVAADAGAVRSTVGDSALLIDAYRPDEVASTVNRVVSDPELRTRLAISAKARLAELSLSNTRSQMANILQAWLQNR